MSGPSSRPHLFPALLVCFFLSGAAGLIDQVVWSKALGLIFGHTAYAVATVLAVFMAGLASGSAWIGGRSERWDRPVALYGWLELGVAATAAISLAGLAGVRAAYVAAFPYAGGSAGALLLLRFLGAALVLFVPTFLMGGTLPVLVRGLTRNAADLGMRLSRLYWINTAGAVAGTFAAGFLFLPSFGLQRTLGIAAALNLAAAALALILARQEPAGTLAQTSSPPETLTAIVSPRPSGFFLVCFAIVGATAMCYEIAWTRLLATQMGSSTYAFTLMLGTFLTGIVLGSALFDRWSRRRDADPAVFAVTQTLTAIAALTFLVFFTREFYAAVRTRLAPNGVFVQWMQAYSLFPDDLRMLLATFLTEFHGATLWHGDAPDLILVAPTPPSGEILRRVQALHEFPGLREDFARLGMEEASGLFGFYLLDDSGLRKFSSGAQLNSDDRTLLEYHAPQSLLVHGLEDTNRAAIVLQQKDPLPADFSREARDDALAASAATSVNQDDAEGAQRFLRALDIRPVTSRIAAVRGRAALARSDFQTAFRAFDAASAIDPGSLEAAWGLAETNRHFGNNEKARAEFQRILERDPRNLPALKSLLKLAVDFSHWAEAENLQRRVLAANPRAGPAARAELAEILMRQGKLDEAYRAMLDCLGEDSYNYQTHLNLAELLAGQKKWAEARTHLEFVMRFFPDQDSRIYPLLFQTDQALGDPRAAANAVRFGLRMFPDNSELQRLNLLLGGTGFNLSHLLN